MDNNFNPNGENENNNSSDSLYSYSYVNREETNNEAQQPTQTQSEPQQSAYQQAPQSQVYYSPYDEPKKKAKKDKKKGSFGKNLGKCAAIALVFGLVGGTVFYGTGAIVDYATGKNTHQTFIQQNGGNNKVTTTSVGTKAVVSDVSDVVDNVMPSIVSITNLTIQQYRDWFGQTYTQETPSAGSGIIVAKSDKELYIATNNHVVQGATTLTVTFADDQTVAAEIKGTDSSTDLAVVKVKLSDISADTMSKIKVATLGDSTKLRLGEPSIAIGNALGNGQSVTTGVISALDRKVTVTDENNNTITNSLIQTDAAINPGNSGGALINVNGEVIGINSVKYTDTKVEGMGYAIPMATAEPIINDLITREVVDKSETAFLGVSGVDVTDEVSEIYNMPKGVYVEQVTPGSAAEKAGIKKGDIITAFDGRKVESFDAMAERIQYYRAGSTVDVTVKTAQEGQWVEKTVSVTLGKRN